MKIHMYLLIVLLSAVTLSANAQVDKKDVRRGNRDFRKENYKEAEIDYRKALVKDSLSLAANYNLAGTLYRTGDMEQAKQALERVKDSAPASAYGADYYFNLGDVAVAMQDWQGAVEAFGKSLLINPGDLQAKENYIYARKKLQDQQQNQQNQNDQNQDQQNDQNQNDQNQDQQNQDQQSDQDDRNQDKKDDGNDKQDQNGQDQDKQDQPQQGQQPKISPQAAQQMLQAIQAKEKETQDKVNKQKAEALKSRQKEKNW